MSRLLPVVIPDREPLTEAEALRIGASAQRLGQLRDILGHTAGGAKFAVGTQGTYTFTLSSTEAQSCIALLMEREMAFLSSFNVAVLPLKETA